MKLKSKIIGLETGGKPIVVLNKEDADDLGVRSLSRVKIFYSKKELTAIVNVSEKLVKKGFIGISEEVKSFFNMRDNVNLEVEVAKLPNSLQFIKNRLNGKRLTYEELYSIVKDVVEGNLTEIEIASFITSLHGFNLDIEEAFALSLAMVETGEKLELNKKVICDKHSVGGIPGDKTSLILVPIIASLGLTIPKTSSRAITSAGGTADKAECLMPVDLDLDEMKRVVEKTNGCIVWGGNLHLAPADDIFIRIEYPLSIDPLLLPSIMGKKKAVGSTHLVVDIPTGRGTKVKTIGEANFLARDFIQLGKKLGIKVNCAITYGEQPIGYNIGPSLEAREALEVISGKKIYDLIDKVSNIAGILLEMVGKKNGKTLALDVLNSGKAKRKLMEIISEQGGNDKIKPEDIPIGNKTYDIISPKNGYVLWINNFDLVEVARTAGAPKDKGAGIRLYKKLNDNVRKGEKILTIFSEKGKKLERAIKLFEDLNAIGIGEKIEMLIHKVEEIRETKKSFILER
jgi:AMP phosphorylase